jgi:hypothetical protein
VQVSLNIATVRSHCPSGLRGRDGQRTDDGTDDGTRGFRGGFI